MSLEGLRAPREKTVSSLLRVHFDRELARIADRATNIAERVIYAVEGELVDLNN